MPAFFSSGIFPTGWLQMDSVRYSPGAKEHTRGDILRSAGN